MNFDSFKNDINKLCAYKLYLSNIHMFKQNLALDNL